MKRMASPYLRTEVQLRSTLGVKIEALVGSVDPFPWRSSRMMPGNEAVWPMAKLRRVWIRNPCSPGSRGTRGCVSAAGPLVRLP